MSTGACPSCGAKSPEGAQFCLSCGKPLTKRGGAPTPTPAVGNVAITMTTLPPQGGERAVATPQDPSRSLTPSEVEALKQAAAWETRMGQMLGFATIFWGVIGMVAPVEDPLVFGIIGLAPGLAGIFAGLAAKQKMMTANQAIANGRAFEFVGFARAEGRNMRRIDVDGGSIKFVAQRIPKALGDATGSEGAPVKVTLTEGGTELPAATETMILAVNGAALPKPVLGQVVVTK